MNDIRSIEALISHLRQVEAFCESKNRPFVTISYAQSIDGSIATKNRQPVAISGQKSLVFTHQLRSIFDGILVGIETVIADNPRLDVRLVDGDNPQPVILDTHLRIPLPSKLLQRTDLRSWLIGAEGNSGERIDEIIQTGADVLTCPQDANGQIDLCQLMPKLYRKGIKSLMVEGGARVITSFIQSQMADQFIVTISPKLMGGLQVIENHKGDSINILTLNHISYERLGNDLILWAKPSWNHQ